LKYYLSKSLLYVFRLKPESLLQEAVWFDVLPRKQEGVGHFSKGKPGHKCRHGEKGGPMQGPAQCLGKFMVATGARGGEVVRPLCIWGIDQMKNGAQMVLQGDPGIKLPAISQDSSQAQA